MASVLLVLRRAMERRPSCVQSPTHGSSCDTVTKYWLKSSSFSKTAGNDCARMRGVACSSGPKTRKGRLGATPLFVLCEQSLVCDPKRSAFVTKVRSLRRVGRCWSHHHSRALQPHTPRFTVRRSFIGKNCRQQSASISGLPQREMQIFELNKTGVAAPFITFGHGNRPQSGVC